MCTAFSGAAEGTSTALWPCAAQAPGTPRWRWPDTADSGRLCFLCWGFCGYSFISSLSGFVTRFYVLDELHPVGTLRQMVVTGSSALGRQRSQGQLGRFWNSYYLWWNLFFHFCILLWTNEMCEYDVPWKPSLKCSMNILNASTYTKTPICHYIYWETYFLFCGKISIYTLSFILLHFTFFSTRGLGPDNI